MGPQVTCVWGGIRFFFFGFGQAGKVAAELRGIGYSERDERSFFLEDWSNNVQG